MTSKKKPSKAAAHQRFTEDEVVSSFAKACQQNSLEATLRQSFHFSDVGILRGLQCFLSRLALGSGGELCLGSGCALRFRTFAVHPPAHLTICPGQFGNRGQFAIVDSLSKEVSLTAQVVFWVGVSRGKPMMSQAATVGNSTCRQDWVRTGTSPQAWKPLEPCGAAGVQNVRTHTEAAGVRCQLLVSYKSTLIQWKLKYLGPIYF